MNDNELPELSDDDRAAVLEAVASSIEAVFAEAGVERARGCGMRLRRFF
jgi:hypothetical protein